MTNDFVVAEALQALAGARHARLGAVERVARKPGLYALYGDGQAWRDLGLSPAFDDQPVYVGKAERSLNGRDIGTHFTTGKTGSSTVRRSLAALLADQLALVPVPRNLAKPDGSANFGLDPAGDARLSDWMEHRLTLATWMKPASTLTDDVETAVISQLRPALNMNKVGESRERPREARKRLADIARAWKPGAVSTARLE
jgi:hypothetical protein